MKKLAVFDLDSTLLEGESINLILDHILKDPDKKNALEQIQHQGMTGKIDLETSLKHRIAFFEGLPLQKLKTLCSTFEWTKGAKETITELKKRGYLTVCLSGGFRSITRRTIEELGLDAYCCNHLTHENGILTGEILGDLLHHESKGDLLMEIQTQLEITPEDTLVVGDGANDLSMFKHANTRIAFCAQNILKDNATHLIETRDLRKVINILPS
jgi:phosphoserine phosphatase